MSNDEKETYTLYKSSRVPGRFALDEPGGHTLSTDYPLWLRFGTFWIVGHVETETDTSYLVSNDKKRDTVELREGMIVMKDD